MVPLQVHELERSLSLPRTIALYTRVSTDIQAKAEAGSLDTQEARLKSALAAKGESEAVFRVFREEGVSGKSLDRPALAELMAQITSGGVRRVMVTRIDRLSRSLLDFYQLTQLFAKHDVEFVSLAESFDTSTPFGRAMMKILLVFAELERETTAERTRVAMQARAAQGLWNGGPRPLGYDPTGSGRLEVIVAEAELVRLMFQRYTELRSAPKLGSWLNTQGHRQKEYTSRRRGPTGGKPFSPASVRQVLTNRIYLGELSHKGETYPGQHAPIVDQELFDRVQSIIADNEKHKGSSVERAHYEYLVSGLLKCACGYSSTPSAGNGRGGRYHYYRCVGLSTKDRHECSVKQVRAERVDEAVLSIVRDAAREPALLAEAVEEANRLSREQVAPTRARVDQLRKELREAERQAEQLVGQALSAGIAASATVQRMIGDVEQRQAQIRNALASAEGELAVRETEQLDLDVVIEAIKGFDAAWDHLAFAEKRELLQLLIKEVVLSPDHVEVALHEGKRVRAWLDTAGRVPGVPCVVPGGEGGREQASQKQQTPGVHPGFAPDSEWLPLPDLNRGPTD